MEKKEFCFYAKDEDDVVLIVCSNHGQDNKRYLEKAKKTKMKRPILVEIQGDVGAYKYTNFALTIDEAKNLMKELSRMIDYLEDI
jgi:UDP-galactopyranose mutase